MPIPVPAERAPYQPASQDMPMTWREIPISQNIVDKWTEELRAFPDNFPQAKTMTEFYNMKEIYKETFIRLLARHPKLKEAHDHVKRRLGERLWSNAVDNKANWKAVHHRLHTYDKEFEESDTYHAELARKKNEDAIASLVSGIVHSNKDKIHDSNK